MRTYLKRYTMDKNLKINRITVKSFRGISKEQYLDLSDVTILYGENGTGKSRQLFGSAAGTMCEQQSGERTPDCLKARIDAFYVVSFIPDSTKWLSGMSKRDMGREKTKGPKRDWAP